MQKRKPQKKSDKELWSLISKKINSGNYLFMNHAKQRLKDRNVTDIEVLDILENKAGCRRKHNKSKDVYTDGYQDWNYCIEGYGLDNHKIRIIISFNDKLLLLITIIRLDNQEQSS